MLEARKPNAKPRVTATSALCRQVEEATNSRKAMQASGGGKAPRIASSECPGCSSTLARNSKAPGQYSQTSGEHTLGMMIYHSSALGGRSGASCNETLSMLSIGKADSSWVFPQPPAKAHCSNLGAAAGLLAGIFR